MLDTLENLTDPGRDSPSEITRLLQGWNDGQPGAREELIGLMYPELRRIAEAKMRAERNNHTLQATALVSEFFLHLARRESVIWKNRGHFLAVASQAMKRLLIDYARAHGASKRGGQQLRIHIDGLELGNTDQTLDIIEFNDLLDHLWAEEPRMAQVAELYCFGGLTHHEIGEVIGVDERTAKRDWQVARAWLIGHLRRTARSAEGRLGKH